MATLFMIMNEQLRGLQKLCPKYSGRDGFCDRSTSGEPLSKETRVAFGSETVWCDGLAGYGATDVFQHDAPPLAQQSRTPGALRVFRSLRTLELGHFVSSEDTVMAHMIESMPALSVQAAGLRCSGSGAVNGVQVCHLQEITLTKQKDQLRTEQKNQPRRAMRPLGNLLTHCQELQLQFYDPRNSWNLRSNIPAVVVVEEDVIKIKALLAQDMTQLKSIQILRLPRVVWKQMIRDVNKYKQQHQQQQPKTTRTLLNLIRLQEIGVLSDEISQLWRYRAFTWRIDVPEYLYTTL
ncbi:hypothetical protein BG015_011180 [Linnemannia schmuckeri]|uniref:Uncharacterized protein n=1 Tax=Linnemannia schmuckeri TaxID=64567 RepID=A0A9P5RWH4_9FUNG|nr:hypothetical protein BG015_011180 [Linnemannia schmuckeri]